jgi:peptide/nickel transport system substrate-binding protein
MYPKEALIMSADIEGYTPRQFGKPLGGLNFLTVKGKTMQDDTEIVIAHGSDAARVSPLRIGDSYSFHIQSLCYDSLVYNNENYEPIVPGLAESWDVSEDQKEITFNLYEDVTWHDGEPFTSEDVKWTFENVVLTFDEPHFHYWTHYRYMRKKIDTVETPDDHTVIFKFKEPHGLFFADCARIMIMAKHRWEDIPRADWLEHEYTYSEPMGTGPYKMANWIKGDYQYYEAKKDYHKGEPFIDKVYIKVLPDSSAAMMALQAGDVQILSDLYGWTGKELEEVEGDPNFNVYIYAWGYTNVMQINTLHPFLGNRFVRQALNYAIPREHIVENLYHGMGAPANQNNPPYSWGHNPNIPMWEYNIDKAKELMMKAGYDMAFLEPPEPIPMSTYLLPALGGLLVGIVASLAVVRVRKT